MRLNGNGVRTGAIGSGCVVFDVCVCDRMEDEMALMCCEIWTGGNQAESISFWWATALRLYKLYGSELPIEADAGKSIGWFLNCVFSCSIVKRVTRVNTLVVSTMHDRCHFEK